MVWGSYVLAYQWKLNNFLLFREKIEQVTAIYCTESRNLFQKYNNMKRDESLTDDIKEERLTEINDEKEYIMDVYLTELEALALYINQNVIEQKIAKEYYFDMITRLDEELKSYIEQQMDISENYFKHLRKLSQKWLDEKRREKNERTKT